MESSVDSNDDDFCSASFSDDGMETTTGTGVERDNTTLKSRATSQLKQVEPDDDVLTAGDEHSYGLACLRLVLMGGLVLTGVALSIAVFLVIRDAEEDEFEGAFESAAASILDAYEPAMIRRIEALVGLAVASTSYANSVTEVWPRVTTNDFAQKAANTRSLAQSAFLAILPRVEEANRNQWEDYSVENRGWINESIYPAIPLDSEISAISSFIFTYEEVTRVRDPGPAPYFPMWQSSPTHVLTKDIVNYNLGSSESYGDSIRRALETGKIQLSGLNSSTVHTEFRLSNGFLQLIAADQDEQPRGHFFVPIFDSFTESKQPVAALFSVFTWASTLSELLSPRIRYPLYAVIENSCDGPFVFRIHGPEVEFIGSGNLRASTSMSRTFNFSLPEAAANGYAIDSEQCVNKLFIHPTDAFRDAFTSPAPYTITCVLASSFLCLCFIFSCYDRVVERRQLLIVNAASRTNAIVSSIFPKQVRERLLEDEVGTVAPQSRTKLKSFLQGEAPEEEERTGDFRLYKSKPIADLFPETTVLFADIAGFTAWSSVREPSQVFTLLETLYGAFDSIATRRRIFKVETVGDCYVAVCGLPDPRKDHATAMSRFARDCMNAALILTRRLEVTLGPDTGDLQIRAGMHSGPVTAGVLRGDRSRFQLFGDTVNTASRMESTGQGSFIHLSQETADLLVQAGKRHWVKKREDQVIAKGKGALQTFWLVFGERPQNDDVNDNSSETSRGLNGPGGVSAADRLKADTAIDDDDDDDDEEEEEEEEESKKVEILASSRIQRLVDWNVDVLTRLLRQILAYRESREIHREEVSSSTMFHMTGETVLDEVCEVITLPSYRKAKHTRVKADSLELPAGVLKQLRDYVQSIAALYRGNPFHNFEHASHVTMSVVKLMSRIIAPPDLAEGAQALHDHTYGITSDPLTQFTCVLGALIHDVDHPGVPNAQLVKEGTNMARFYKNKSVAEQNSVDLAWSLLSDEKYNDLRNTIYCNEDELKRFRALLVNLIMATDIVDKQLKQLRNARWEKAFSESAISLSDHTKPYTQREDVNRKATIVIEHLLQASDVSHTMQHWHVYRKWNERLFLECYTAYRDGRAETNPLDNWYKGEIGFFDFYIIPLAKKLKDCGVFGVSSDEYLNYAVKNREEWTLKGQEVVALMLEKVKKIWPDTMDEHDVSPALVNY